MRGDYHTHSIFDDGKSTLMQMAESAERKGMFYLGFSAHSYQSFDESFCVKRNKFQEYLREAREIQALFEAEGRRTNILVGIEQDLFGKQEKGLDYTIGSVHYLHQGGEYLCIDASPERLSRIVEEVYGGDWYRMTEDYFDLVETLPERTGCDIIGHFDLVAKFNAGNRFFDEESPRYLRRAGEVMESLVKKNVVFEINTGAMSRGYRDIPYPNMPLLSLLRQLGGEIIINSDAHTAGTIGYGFDYACAAAAKAGFSYTNLLTRSGFAKIGLSCFQGWQEEYGYRRA